MATAPAFRHDGTGIAYVSTNSITSSDGERPIRAILYVISPTPAAQGGPATPVTGAADPNCKSTAPPSRRTTAFIAFTRIAGTGNVAYSVPEAEVFVVPSAGGVATRLAANDAPACQTGLQSPGRTNDWPKWSPDVGQANGKHHYWITFSSKQNRRGAALRRGARGRRCRQPVDLPGPLSLKLTRRPRSGLPHRPGTTSRFPTHHHRLM